MAKETIVLRSLPRQAAPLPRGPQQARMVGVGRGHRRGTMDMAMVGGNHTGGRRQDHHPLPTRPGPQCRQPSHGQAGPLQRLPAANGHLLKGHRCHHQDCALTGAAGRHDLRAVLRQTTWRRWKWRMRTAAAPCPVPRLCPPGARQPHPPRRGQTLRWHAPRCHPRSLRRLAPQQHFDVLGAC